MERISGMSRQVCRVLVVDDEAAMREVLQARLERWGFDVQLAENVQQARSAVAQFEPHVVISDLVLPDATGLDLLQALQGSDDQRVVLLITAYGTIDTAVQAIKGGATDFLTKPLDYVVLRQQLEAVQARLAEVGGEPSSPPPPTHEVQEPALGGMVGASAAHTAMLEHLRLAASSASAVLVVGESGSGKELVARTIHELSPRAKGPFVPVNAAAVPEALAEGEFFGHERGAFTGAGDARAGLFESADGGTLFLDEVTEMPLALQAKFLRVLEDGKIRRVGGRSERACDVRVIAATNRNPADTVAKGDFRRDLLYRLDVLRINVPPLRDRREDIGLLAAHFLDEYARRYEVESRSITRAALERLSAHDWPGNVRELRNVLERAFIVAHDGVIDVEQLSIDASDDPRSPSDGSLGVVIPYGVTVAEAERILILETLKRTGNNKAEAARRLGVDVKTIRNKLKTFEGGA
jgi:DNA-binding NtrC family response regulator